MGDGEKSTVAQELSQECSTGLPFWEPILHKIKNTL